jgi:prolyl 4-hydroxylase
MTKRELAGRDVFVIDSFFTPEECLEQIARTERAGFEDAPITTGSGFVMAKHIRNNARVMLDDMDMAGHLWERLRPFVPERLGYWLPIGLNERFRFYRYDVGEKFAPHYDGAFERTMKERSQLTFMVYLNAGFEGGETIFHDYEQPIVVQPATGMALLFIHRQLHEGAPVKQGRKYVLRSDVMCRYSPPPVTEDPESITGLDRLPG